jgi:hypothetical protein
MPTSTTRADEWKPVLNGGVYCSPRCGNSCKKIDHDLAVKAGEALARQLGPDWKPRIHENCAWFYSAVNKFASISEAQNWFRDGVPASTIYPDRYKDENKFCCMLNLPHKQFVTYGKTPKAAYWAAIKAADLYVSELAEQLVKQQKSL